VGGLEAMCFTQFMVENGIGIIAIFATLAALGFSIFGAIYSNYTHNIRMADASAFQCISEGSRQSWRSYQSWRRVSVDFRGLAIRRAYTASLFFWSLFFTIVTLILYLIATPDFTNGALNRSFLGTSAFALFLFGMAVAIVLFEWEGLVKFFGRCCCPIRCFVRWPVNPDFLKYPGYLKDC
jgi:hypothetical protein